MDNSKFRKTTLASLVAATCAAATIPGAEANVVNVSWSGAFTFLHPDGSPIPNVQSNYAYGHYSTIAGGLGAATTHGWYGNRTPVTGTMSFDTSTGAGVATVTPFFFFGKTPGSGVGTNVARFGGSFATIDTVGTLVGTMLMSWNGIGQSVSLVLNASGLLANLGAAIAGGPTSTISGVGALPATDGTNFGTTNTPKFLPLGPAPVATETLNTGSGCNGLTLATQVNAYTITRNSAAVTTCTTGMVDDGVGGSPMTGTATSGFNVNFDFTSAHLDSVVSAPVPVPASAWLFGSGVVGLLGVIRKRKTA